MNLKSSNYNYISFVERIVHTSFNTLLGIWLGVVILFGAIYWMFGLLWYPILVQNNVPLEPIISNLWAHIYFSFVTATSIGFGDIVPIGLARFFAIVEGAAGLLIFGGVITKLVSTRHEQLIEEIHLLTFENRIERVQTNLHIVLSELQLLSNECKNSDIPQDRLQSRIESATMVLIGELRAIHDLLYRPQLEPEESVLEALLANLVACLSELKGLIDKLDDGVDSSSYLKEILSMIRILSNEICADCVPREYDKKLKLWMNRVQEQADLFPI